MNSAEITLVQKLIPMLSVRGFKWLKSREMFLRREPYGFSSFAWSSYITQENGGEVELIPLLGIRHDVVEDVVNELGLIHGNDNKKYTMTIDRGLGLFPFKADKDYKQHICLTDVVNDVEHAATSIDLILDKEGCVFLEQYASLLECSRGLNDPIETSTHPLCNNFPLRAYHGVATAFFAENERVSELVHQYLGFAKALEPNKYDQIARRLDQLVSIAEKKMGSKNGKDKDTYRIN